MAVLNPNMSKNNSQYNSDSFKNGLTSYAPIIIPFEKDMSEISLRISLRFPNRFSLAKSFLDSRNINEYINEISLICIVNVYSS